MTDSFLATFWSETGETKNFLNPMAAFLFLSRLSIQEQSQWFFLHPQSEEKLSLEKFAHFFMLQDSPETRSTSAEDRREHVRKKRRIFVTIEFGSTTFLAHTSDISLGGLRLHRKILNLSKDSRCNVKIHPFDGTETLTIPGLLLPESERTPYTRVQFVSMPSPLLQSLEALLKSLDMPEEKKAA